MKVYSNSNNQAFTQHLHVALQISENITIQIYTSKSQLIKGLSSNQQKPIKRTDSSFDNQSKYTVIGSIPYILMCHNL